jgi:hypothetical protein
VPFIPRTRISDKATPSAYRRRAAAAEMDDGP